MSLKKDADKALTRKFGKPPGPATPARPAQPASDKPVKKLNWSMDDLLNKQLPAGGEGAKPAEPEVGQLKQVAEFTSSIGAEEAFDLSTVIEGQAEHVTISSRTDHPVIAEPATAEPASTQSAETSEEASGYSSAETDAQTYVEEEQNYHDQKSASEAYSSEESPVFAGEEPQAYSEEVGAESNESTSEQEYETSEASPEPVYEIAEEYASDPQAYSEEYAAPEPQRFVETGEHPVVKAQDSQQAEDQAVVEQRFVATGEHPVMPQHFVATGDHPVANVDTHEMTDDHHAFAAEAVADAAEEYADNTEEAPVVSDEQIEEIQEFDEAAEVEPQHAEETQAVDQESNVAESYSDAEPAESLSEEPQPSTDEAPSAFPLADLDAIAGPAAYGKADVGAEPSETTTAKESAFSLADLNAITSPSSSALQSAADIAAEPVVAKDSAFSLSELDSIKPPANLSGKIDTAKESSQPSAKPSAASGLLKKAIEKKSEILNKTDQPASVEPAAPADGGSGQPPSQFNRKDVLQKIVDKPAEAKPPEGTAGATKSDKPAEGEREKHGVFSKRRPEPETKSKFVQDLLSAAKVHKAEEAKEDTAAQEEARKRNEEKLSRTGRMKTLIDKVPLAEEQIVSARTIEKTKAAKENAKAFLTDHKKHFIAGAAVLLVAFAGVTAYQTHDKAEISAQLKEKIESKKIEDGMDLVSAALAKYPDEGKFHYYKGRLYMRMMDFKNAIIEMNQAVAQAPNDPEIRAHRALLNFWVRDVKQSAKDFDAAFADPKYIASLPADERATLYSNRAGASMAIGKQKDALAYLNEAIKLQPKLLINYRGKAWCLSSLGQNDNAIKVWTYIIGQAPKDPINYVERARTEYGAKQNAAGDADVAKALSIKPIAEAYDLRSDRDLAAKNMSAFLVDIGKAIAAAPNNAYFRRKRADEFLRNGEGAAALKDLDALETMGAAEDDKLIAQRAELRQRAGEYALAAHDYTKLMKKHPSEKLLAARADCYAKAGDTTLATEDYGKLIGEKPTVEYYLKRAAIYMKHNDTQLAEADFAEAFKLKPNSAAVYLARGLAYGDSKLYDQALVDMKHVLEIQPNNDVAKQKLREYQKVRSVFAKAQGSSTSLPPLPANLDKNDPAIAGYQLMQSGNTELALKKFAEAIKKNPNNAELRRYLANALVIMGRPGEAVAQFQALGMLGALDRADEDKMVQAAIDAEKYMVAAQIYTRRIGKNPDDFASRMALASVYLKLGPQGLTLFKQTCQAGIAAAKTKQQADQFRDLMSSQEQTQELQKLDPSKMPNYGG
ncbi:MAG TPA: tetratricopeptide repeat protein [Planktothrix sp.]|jgi:tetratricopeptide (TPR) repeat protein